MLRSKVETSGFVETMGLVFSVLTAFMKDDQSNICMAAMIIFLQSLGDFCAWKLQGKYTFLAHVCGTACMCIGIELYCMHQLVTTLTLVWWELQTLQTQSRAIHCVDTSSFLRSWTSSYASELVTMLCMPLLVFLACIYAQYWHCMCKMWILRFS